MSEKQPDLTRWQVELIEIWTKRLDKLTSHLDEAYNILAEYDSIQLLEFDPLEQRKIRARKVHIQRLIDQYLEDFKELKRLVKDLASPDSENK